eukprot:8998327-Heterocapsa_arctica.AAC.1
MFCLGVKRCWLFGDMAMLPWPDVCLSIVFGEEVRVGEEVVRRGRFLDRAAPARRRFWIVLQGDAVVLVRLARLR